MSPWASSLYTIFSHHPYKSLFAENTYELLLKYLYTGQILLSNSFNSSPKCPPAQLAGAIEYTDCIDAEGWDPSQWVSWCEI